MQPPSGAASVFSRDWLVDRISQPIHRSSIASIFFFYISCVCVCVCLCVILPVGLIYFRHLTPEEEVHCTDWASVLTQ